MFNIREDMKEYIQRNDEKLSEIQASVSFCKNGVMNLEDDIQNVNSTVTISGEEIENLNKFNLENLDMIAEVQSSVDRLSEDLVDTVSNDEDRVARITNMEQIVDMNQEKISKVQESVNFLAKGLTDLRGNIVQVKDEVGTLDDIIESYAQSVLEVNTTVERNSAQITDVSEDVSSISSTNQKQDILINNNMQRLNAISKRAQWCGYQNEWSSENSVIQYEKVSYNNTNMDITGKPLDINSGNQLDLRYYSVKLR